ncbi:MAG: tRNA (guanosine(46)-N7)-methyltransferase TrmB [Thermoanaerobaculia bacterium]
MQTPETISSPLVTLESAGINPREREGAPIDLFALFGNLNPVVLEIGSGKGRFLIDHGKAHPEKNFLGIEKSLHYHRVIVDRIVRHALPNVKTINYDAFDVMQNLLPSGSMSEIHIYFPDPWPRKRERKRRIIRPAAVEAMRRILAAEGEGWYVTDHEEYFEEAVPVMANVFAIEAGEIVHEPPRTNYEAKYQAQGRPIYQIAFRLK